MEPDEPILPEATFHQLFDELERRGDVALMCYIKNLGTKEEIIEWRFAGCIFTGIGLCEFMRDQLLGEADKREPVEDDR